MLQQATIPADGIELLSFQVGEQEYCVEITSVREIRSRTPTTPLPFSPPHVRGVMNLRGTIITVIDLAARLGMSPTRESKSNVIVVVQSGEELAGLLVDAVSNILSVPRGAAQTPPEVGNISASNFIDALLVAEGNLIRVLNLQAVILKEKPLPV